MKGCLVVYYIKRLLIRLILRKDLVNIVYDCLLEETLKEENMPDPDVYYLKRLNYLLDLFFNRR